jgi:hypothetical protein
MRIQPREKGDPKGLARRNAAASYAGRTYRPGTGARPAFHQSFGFERGEAVRSSDGGWTSVTKGR